MRRESQGVARLLILLLGLAGVASAQESRLDKMGREVTERAVKDFKSKDANKRLSAVQSLSSWARPEGTAILIQGLADPDERVRAESARSLRTYAKAAEPAREALKRALDDPRPAVVVQAAEALEQALGMSEKELGPARLRLLEAGDVTESFLAARSLTGQAPAPRLVEPILSYIEDQLAGLSSANDKNREASENNLEIGHTALQNLVKKTHDRALIPPLTNAARDFRVRNDVPLKALSLFDPRPPGWARLLTDQLESRDPKVLTQVLSLMGSTAAASARDVATWAPEAVRLERNPDASVRRALVGALGDAGGLASDYIDVPLHALAQETDRDFRRAAAGAVGDIGDRNQATPAAGKRLVAERAAPILKEAMASDADADVREAATRALGRLMTSGGASPAKGTSAAPASPASGASAKGAAPIPAAPSSAASAPASSRGAARDSATEAEALSFLRARKLAVDPNSFMGALTERDPQVIRAYLDAGLSGRDPVASGDTPLSFLLRAGACSPVQRPTPAAVKEIVGLLIERGADVNLGDGRNNTPLMAAAMGGCDRETIGLLIKAGAKIDARNASGLTAFEMGLFSGHDGLEALIAAGYRLPPDKAALYRQSYASNPKALELIDRATAPAKK